MFLALWSRSLKRFKDKLEAGSGAAILEIQEQNILRLRLLAENYENIQ